MTVKLFVAKDSAGREWGPDYNHEMEWLIEMLQKLWAAYHHMPHAYCVVANLQHPVSGDLVILSERGLGVAELKHYPGSVRMEPDGIWYADRARVKGGADRPTPALQVNGYAEQIRKLVLRDILPAALKSTPERWNELKFQTAVIFTNPQADVRQIKEQVKTHRSIQLPPWVDNFSILTPAEFVKWAVGLQFGVKKHSPQVGFDAYRLNRTYMQGLIKQAFGGMEWIEILPLMPTGEPYAYLSRLDIDTTYSIVRDTVVIGRNPDCDIAIPNEFGRASRQHCKLIHYLNGVELQDLDSKHGTYLDGTLVTKSTLLSHGQVISLGGSHNAERVCSLKFEMRGLSGRDLAVTDSSSKPE